MPTQRVTVMGLGRFGGGVGAVRFFAAQGAQVTVTDLQPAAALTESLEAISGLPVTLVLGEHRERDFRDCDLVVASPAVPRDNRFLAIARDAGVPVTSEMNLFWEGNRGRTVCVTGSNGKSTTTAAIHAILAETGRRAWLGGNIGRSLLPQVHEIGPTDWVVLELSSFQLEDLAPLEPRPDVAVVTNFSPNHLDRHKTVEAYRTAKQNLLGWQTAEQTAVLNQDDLDVRTWPTSARRLWFGTRDTGDEGCFLVSDRALLRVGPHEHVLPLKQWWTLLGSHNLQNALAAICAAHAAGARVPAIEHGLRRFRPLPHRLQPVAEHAGRTFVNDSKATTPEAAALAIQAFDRPVILLAGGYDKGIDLLPMVAAAVDRGVKAVALFGATAEALAKLFEARDPAKSILRTTCATLEEALVWAMQQSAAKDVVLLSPGCASYDQFRDYEHRGETFTRLAGDVSSPRR